MGLWVVRPNHMEGQARPTFTSREKRERQAQATGRRSAEPSQLLHHRKRRHSATFKKGSATRPCNHTLSRNRPVSHPALLTLSAILPGRGSNALFRGGRGALFRGAPAAIALGVAVKRVDHDGVSASTERRAVSSARHGAGKVGNLDQRRWETLAAVALCVGSWGRCVFFMRRISKNTRWTKPVWAEEKRTGEDALVLVRCLRPRCPCSIVS